MKDSTSFLTFNIWFAATWVLGAHGPIWGMAGLLCCVMFTSIAVHQEQKDKKGGDV